MLFGGNYNYLHAFFNNHTRIFEGNEVLLLSPSPTRFVTHFPLMMRTLRLKDALRGNVHLQEFITFKLRKEEVTVAMIKTINKFIKSKSS